jgi:YaiO family outer membrane protein
MIPSRTLRVPVLMVAAMARLARGDEPDPDAQDPSSNGPATAVAGGYALSPIRVELGGYSSYVNNGFGPWSGGQAQLWYRSRFFTPAFTVDRQTRPQGTQWNYAFFSYANWSKSFYTTQGFSWAPQKDPLDVYFPQKRYDIKGYWKLLSEKNFVIDAGFTRFDLGAPGHGQIFSAGSLYYHGKWVIDGNLFINRSQPGDLYSASGLLAVQHGQEGRYWVGVTAGGGRELYQLAGQTPFEARFTSYSLGAFYRRWFSRHAGVVFSGQFLNKLDAYRQAGGSASLFFEF